MWIVASICLFFPPLSFYKVHTYQKYHKVTASALPLSVFDVFTVQITAGNKGNRKKKGKITADLCEK